MATSNCQFIYCYGGNLVPEYNYDRKNLHKFHNPEVNCHLLLEQSSILFQIDVDDCTIKSVKVSPDYKTANGTMQIISKTEKGEADKIVILGGYNRQILLYSKSEFILHKCDIDEEYGGCRLKFMTPTTI